MAIKMRGNLNFSNYKKIDRTQIRYKNVLDYLLRDQIKILNKDLSYRNILQDGKLRRKSLFDVVFTIRPTELSKEYTLLLVYKEESVPIIYVLSPNLQEESNGIKIPHLYCQKTLRLCLYYPNNKEFLLDDYIAEQVIPWIKLWLYNYEVWLYTKKWLGGGIHPGDEQDTEAKQKIKKKKNSKLKKCVNHNDYLSIANNIYFAKKKAINEMV